MNAYKHLPNADKTEDTAQSKPKEADGADEKMLPKEEAHPNNKLPISEKQNGDTKLQIGDLKAGFVGMGKEELLKYVNDPFWIKIRWALFIAFWLLWTAMLVSAIYLIWAAPKCTQPPPPTWWESGPLTQINSEIKPEDIAKLDEHLEGVIVTWPDDAYAPFNQSHKTIQLVNNLKAKGKHVILEVDPTYSNVWFEKSETGNINYTNYYIWKEGSGTGSPNNWVGPNNTPAWKKSTHNSRSGFYYYAPFDKPHLNFRNQSVVEEFGKVLKSFLSMNVSGIRLKNAAFLLVDAQMDNQAPRTQPQREGVKPSLGEYDFYDHSKTEYRPELAGLVKQWRDLVKNQTGDGPLMVAEEIMKPAAFKVKDNLVVDLPLQELVFSKEVFSVAEVANSLNVTFKADRILWPLWKAPTKAVPKDVLNMITYLLPGTPLVEPNEALNKDLIKLRNSPSITRGETYLYRLKGDTVFAFIRYHSESPGVLVMVNPGNETSTVNLSAEVPLLKEVTDVTVNMWSSNYKEEEFMDKNAKKPTTAIPVSAKSGIIFEYVPKKEGDTSH